MLVIFLVLVSFALCQPQSWFDRIFILTFSDSGLNSTMQDPEFLEYSEEGLLLTNYYASYHPSQPNYFDQGSNLGISDDDSHNLLDKFLGNQLESKGITWKVYQENYPQNCANSSSGSYLRYHNPFISFEYIRNNATLCSKIVDSSQLDIDLNNGQLPQYSYYTPNSENSGANITNLGEYLHTFLHTKFVKFPNRTLLVITFDQDPDKNSRNQVFTLLLGSTIKPGTSNKSFTHSSLLRTVQDNWALGSLGRGDANAIPFFQVIIPESPPNYFGLVLCVLILLVILVFGVVQVIHQKITGGSVGSPFNLASTSVVDQEETKSETKVQLDSDSDSQTL